MRVVSTCGEARVAEEVWRPVVEGAWRNGVDRAVADDSGVDATDDW